MPISAIAVDDLSVCNASGRKARLLPIDLGTAGFNDGVRRLARYRCFDEGGRGPGAVLEDLAIAVAEANGGAFPGLAECQRGCRHLWSGLEVELEQLRDAKRRLVEAGLVEPNGSGFVLTAAARDGLRARAAATSETEAAALERWINDVLELYPKLTAADVEYLHEDLSKWLARIVARPGAEAALMLYPEQPSAHRRFNRIESFGTDFLPTRSDAVMKIRDRALKAFVRGPTAEQRSFLANRLNASFYLTVLTLDPAAKKLAEREAAGARVYIDTDVLFTVLGMASAEEVAAAHRLLELTREIDYHIAVTPVDGGGVASEHRPSTAQLPGRG